MDTTKYYVESRTGLTSEHRSKDAAVRKAKTFKGGAKVTMTVKHNSRVTDTVIWPRRGVAVRRPD